MNILFRTSGPTTIYLTTALFVFVTTILCVSCAATPNILVTTTTTNPTVTNGTESQSVSKAVSTIGPEVVSTARQVSTTSVQDVNQTEASLVILTTSTSTVTPPSPRPSSSVPVSESASVVASTTEYPASYFTTEPASAVPEESSSTQTSASTLAPPTSTTTQSTNSTNSTTTPTPKPLISFDPDTGIIISEPNLDSLIYSSNDSKLVIKYVNKANDALTKQTQKFTFKSKSSNENGTIPKFVAKFLVKNASLTSERKFEDFMPDEIRNRGGVILHVVMLIYVCLSLGIICDLYFLTSIEYIGNILNLPADIAGATFMALGTSAPELFIALIGVFIAEDDIGTSTVLGSAVFNLIFVPSICGFTIYFSNMKYPKINKYAILRDAIFYIIAITTLLLALKDNEIDWMESTCMIALYCIYITVLYFNAQLGELIEEDSDSECDTFESETSPLLQSQNSTIACFTKSEKHMLTKSADWLEDGAVSRQRSKGSFIARPIARTNSIRTSSIRNGSMLALPNGHGYVPIDPIKAIHEEPSGMPENWAESHWILKFAMLPVVILIKLTVPKPNKHNYFLTFVISILWISACTYMSVWLVTIIGYTLQLPQTVLGLTILAAGTSIPEVISCVIVVKRAGLANMALCNLFGSNIFDILVCLSLPWLIKTVINMVHMGTVDMVATTVAVQSHGLIFAVFTLLVCVVAYVITLGSSGWKLGLSVGVTCSIIYFVAITLASVYEILLN